MTIRKLTSSLQLAVLPFLPLQEHTHGHGVAHPLVSLFLIVVLLARVAWTFRRKTR